MSEQGNGEAMSTETTTTPAKPKLATALAAFQAKLPEVRKGATATIKNDQGVKLYDYSYADLADVSNAAMPLLGGLGLAFTSRPTFSARGDFVLAYSLLHTSGEREDGEYPLPDPLRVKPQVLGSAITYAKRYCLCAVTGIAPHGDDDDGAKAQESGSTAGSRYGEGSPFDAPAGDAQATPPANGSARRGQATRPAAAEPAGTETDQDWLADIMPQCSTFATTEEGNTLWRRINEKGKAHGCTDADAATLKDLIKARWQELPADTPATSGEQEAAV